MLLPKGVDDIDDIFLDVIGASATIKSYSFLTRTAKGLQE